MSFIGGVRLNIKGRILFYWVVVCVCVFSSHSLGCGTYVIEDNIIQYSTV